jgi:HEAT repeat protein
MHEAKKAGVSLSLGLALLIFTGFGAREVTSSPNRNLDIARHIATLRSGKAQQKAAAAYWLGQQRMAAADAVEALVDLLADTTEVDPSQYRRVDADPKSTLGVEAAAALVNIGHPAIEPLIRVLKTSPQTEARKNAAWALGAIQQSGAVNSVREPWTGTSGMPGKS